MLIHWSASDVSVPVERVEKSSYCGGRWRVAQHVAKTY
jgi:hypothetical protein